MHSYYTLEQWVEVSVLFGLTVWVLNEIIHKDCYHIGAFSNCGAHVHSTYICKCQTQTHPIICLDGQSHSPIDRKPVACEKFSHNVSLNGMPD